MLQESQTLYGHTDRVWTLAWNPAGTILASSGADKTIRLWIEKEPGRWESASILADTHSKSIRRLCWSPCGNYLASASFDSTVCLWRRNTIDGTWTTVVNLEGHESEVKSIAWSYDGQYLASCGRDRTIWIWERATNTAELDSEEAESDDAENWDCSDVKNDHTKDVKHIVWHPSHNLLVSTSYDDTVKLFHRDGEDWKCFDTLRAHASTVWSADFSTSGEYLVTCSDDRTIRIWKNHAHSEMPVVQANSWKCTSVVQGYHSRPIYDVSWCKQADVIVSASGDNSIAIYERDSANSQEGDIFSCVQKYNQAHKCDVNAICWNPKSANLLASGGDDRCIKLWKYSDDVPQGTKALSVIAEIMGNLTQLSLNCQSESNPHQQIDSTTETHMTFNVNNFTNLFNITHQLQTLQSEIYVDEEKKKLTKRLGLKFSYENLPPVRLSGLISDESNNRTKGFYVDVVDDSGQIRYKFKMDFDGSSEEFKLMLPRRSVKLIAVAEELFLLEKTGDLYKVLLNGRSEFLLGHLFTFSDVQFVTDFEKKKILFIISADRDEKIRITNYPNTFQIERYCFGHRHLLSRILVVEGGKFISIDREGEVCVWNLEQLMGERLKPLKPIEVISINEDNSKKRLRVH